MTDIVFLLLIFFMLTVSSVTQEGLPVDLPKSQHGETLTTQVNVTITKDLSYYIDQQKIFQDQLEERLKQKLDKKEPSVLLQIDKNVPVAHLIYVTDIAANLNAKVSVATQPD